MKPFHCHLLLALAAIFGLLSVPTNASTVFWGSAFNDNLFDSNGQPLDSTYSFEIGSFGSFVPTYQNVDQWTANWKVIDRAFDPDANGWNTTDQFFVGTVGMTTSGTSDSPDANPSDVFAQGETIYLWAYNSKIIVPSSEWALVAALETRTHSATRNGLSCPASKIRPRNGKISRSLSYSHLILT